MSWKNEYIMFTFKIDEDKLYETNNPKIILKYTAFGKDFEDKIKSEFYTKSSSSQNYTSDYNNKFPLYYPIIIILNYLQGLRIQNTHL